jgi:hypothetical protein
MIVKNVINELPHSYFFPLVSRLIFLQGIFSGGYNPTLHLAKLNQKPNHIKNIELIINVFQRLFLVLNKYFDH